MKNILQKSFFLLLALAVLSCKEGIDPSTAENLVLAQIKEPKIPSLTLNVLDYGAKGDSVTDCKAHIDAAINDLEKRGGGKLVFPKGQYFIKGPIHLVSDMELHLEQGARLFFSSAPQDYLPVVKTSWEGTFLYNYSPFVYARNCTNIALTGKGTIDGEASETWQHWKARQKESQLLSREMNNGNVPVEERIFGEGHYLRPHLIQFFDCKNILVEDVKMEDSPFWCLHLLRCENVTVRGVRYDAHNYNNDGIDPEYSRNVLIENVTFNNADDNVAIKAGRDREGRASGQGSENIVIRNCHFMGLHAVVIGSEMSAGVENVFVRDCSYAGKLKRGLYLKSNPDRGGFIRNIYVNNVEFGEVEDCIYVTSFYHNEGEGHVTDISGIYISNIRCKKATGSGIVLQGFPEKKVRDIYLTNIQIDSANNPLSMSDTENIVFNDVVIGELATSPSYVK
jgi:polygalacturonase